MHLDEFLVTCIPRSLDLSCTGATRKHLFALVIKYSSTNSQYFHLFHFQWIVDAVFLGIFEMRRFQMQEWYRNLSQAVSLHPSISANASPQSVWNWRMADDPSFDMERLVMDWI